VFLLYSSTRRSLCRRYDKGGETLCRLWPIKSAIVTSMHVPDIFRDILESIFNDEKSTPSKKRRQLQKSRVVATLHNLSLFRNQVVLTTNKLRCLSNTGLYKTTAIMSNISFDRAAGQADRPKKFQLSQVSCYKNDLNQQHLT